MGFYLAWRSDTVASYHAIMSVVFIPMWLLSGALFPSNGVAIWLEWLMKINPVTYAMEGLRIVFYSTPMGLLNDTSFVFAFMVTFGWAVFTVFMSMRIVQRNS